MKALKAMATINEQGQITLDSPLLTNKNSRVEIIVLIPEPAEDWQWFSLIKGRKDYWAKD